MVKRLVGAMAVGVFVVAGLASHANAFSEPIGTKISLIKPGSLYKIVSKPTTTGTFTLPAGDVSAQGGGVTVTANGGTLECTLAAQAYDGIEGWKGLGNPKGSKGWKYLNKLAPTAGTAGACKLVLIKEKVIKVLGEGTDDLVVRGRGDNSEVTLQLDAGSDSYCALATPPHFKEVEGSLLKMKDEPAPADCETTTTTIVTTTTTSSTTTTTLRFVDNGDGTITDNQTGLMWEKKDSDDATPNPANLHDVDNTYPWAGCCDGDCESSVYVFCQPNAAAAAACSAQTGGAVGCSECSVGTCETSGRQTIWDWLVQVNTEGFAGHSDWRIPSEDGCNDCWTGHSCTCNPGELQSIQLEPWPCGTHPCIDPIFGPTASEYYWTSTTFTRDGQQLGAAYAVAFGYDGSVGVGDLHVITFLRVVRGGSPSAAFLDVTTGVLD